MNDLNVRIPVRWLKAALIAAAAAAVAFPAGALASQALGDRFDDVDAADTHAAAVGWLADAGVTAGCTPDAYCPGEPVTRAQMATFMRRLAGGDPGTAPAVDAATVQGYGPADLQPDLSGIEGRLDDLEGEVADLEAANAELEGELAEVQEDNEQLTALLAGVERVELDGHDTLRFAGMNVQLVNGSGSTHGEPDGLGNLVIGYHAHGGETRDRGGSHYLVVGDQHAYTAFGGIVAGLQNTASGDWASVTGGSGNVASGGRASVTGGGGNEASGLSASVTGGAHNEASGPGASVAGGQGNEASGDRASVSGGGGTTGMGNHAAGDESSVLGGVNEHVGGTNGCHPGCL